MFAGCKSNRQVRNDKSHERPLKCESNRAKYRRTGGINPIHQPAWIKALTLAKLRSSVNNQSNPPKHARQSNNNRWGSPSSFGDLHRPSSSFGNLRKPSETFGDLWRPSRFFEVLRSGETLPPPSPSPNVKDRKQHARLFQFDRNRDSRADGRRADESRVECDESD